tara:strand:+ start:2141 stop:2614 length:474 start_codon:yes stop_codon:yes gene_type:complete
MDNNKLILCKSINDKITQLNKNEIEEIFKIIYESNSKYTHNSNGIFVNLAWVDLQILDKIKKYIDFCINSHFENKNHESYKNKLSSTISNTSLIQTEEEIKKNEENVNEEDSQKNLTIKRINSNIKFYLAKKRLDFNKENKAKYLLDNVLSHDSIII